MSMTDFDVCNLRKIQLIVNNFNKIHHTSTSYKVLAIESPFIVCLEDENICFLKELREGKVAINYIISQINKILPNI